jgi:putative hydrolase of the HAD superfamily
MTPAGQLTAKRMIMKKYRHLFFDLDNTLWDFNLNSYHALKENFARYRLSLQHFDLFFETYIAHNERLWELYRQKKITKEDLSRSRFELSFSDTGMTGIDATAFNRDYLELMPLQTKLCEGAMKVLETLASNYEMHIITNGFAEVQYKKLGNSNLSHFFKRVFISEEIKSPKPSPEIFRHALKSCNARKKESLMVGDSWDVDILGAAGIGMDQVFYQPDEELVTEDNQLIKKHITGKTTTYFISNLHQLLKIL